MTGKLVYYATDPNGKGRGSGLYYHGGRGKFSKYSQERDRHISARTKIKHGNIRYAHTGDGTYRKDKKMGKGIKTFYRRAIKDKRI